MTSRPTSRRARRRRDAQYRIRFGLPAAAVFPLFDVPVHRGPWAAGATVPFEGAEPCALVVYDPSLTGPRRLVARVGTSRSVTVGVRSRPVSMKALACVGAGAVAGVLLAQPLDPVTYLAPLGGVMVGGAAGGAGWAAVRGRGSTTIAVEQWRGQLDAVRRILRNADRIGQPFVSPQGLRAAVHVALWHAANAVGEPGEGEVLQALDDQLASLRVATEAALSELESPSIAARKEAVSERLSAAVDELTAAVPVAGDGDRAGEAAT